MSSISIIKQSSKATWQDDANLSYAAKGVLASLLYSKRRGKNKCATADILAKFGNCNRSTALAYLNDLIAAGYLRRTQLYDSRGRACGTHVEISESPMPLKVEYDEEPPQQPQQMVVNFNFTIS